MTEVLNVSDVSFFTDFPSFRSKYRIYFLLSFKTEKDESQKRYRNREQIQGDPDRATKNQSDCRIRYRALLEKIKRHMLTALKMFL